MPLVVTDKEAAKHKNRGGVLNKFVRRSRTLNEEKLPTKERSKPHPRHASQSLEDLVRCAICLEQLIRPTMLPCQHTFCLACLKIYARKKPTVIGCPTCRLEVTLPLEGISALPTNILLQAFLESIATTGSANGGSDNLSRDDTSSRTASKTSTAVCVRCYGSSPHDSTCPHCNQLFCKSCHLLHVAELRKDWSNVIDDLFAEKQRISMIKEEFRVRCKKLRNNIRATVAIQVQQLSEKQDQLLAELKTWSENEATKFTQVEQLCDQVLDQTPTIGSSDEEPIPETNVLKRSEAILQTARQCGTTRLMFDSEELSLTCQSTEMDGGVGACNAAPSSSSASAAALHASTIHNESSAHGRRKSRRVLFVEPGVESVHPTPPHLDSPTESKKPTEFLSTADERSLYYRSLSGHLRHRITSTLLQRPAGVAVSPWTGETYVAATDSHRVYVIDKSGKIVKSLGSPYRSNDRLGGGTADTFTNGATTTSASNANCGTFLCPFGIAFSTVAEEIYVTDKWLNCIQVFNKEGVYVRQIGVKGTSPGHFRSPEGIAVDFKGNIYVCDTCNDRVQVLDRNGVYFRELGVVSPMTLPGGKLYQKREFSEPTGVAVRGWLRNRKLNEVSPDGSRIAVCDFGNCRIKVFGSNGELLVVFGFRGTQRGQFQHPECLVVDDQGFILVGDNGNGRIQIFRPNGNFVRSLGSKGSGPGQFNWISGLTLSKDRDIIATDFKNHCIQIF
ncbi:RING finger protein nhl-1-like isoform X2 [Daphnia pulex]|uniref:RING finger protein nhl-1-like isoform X2 n=1 Tax=Daphnia pulex TaxID=6669 RepID=UPI001EDCCC9D|nr:RING finger protein nhl-1-like isoform X2 [Daphnia pulex]